MNTKKRTRTNNIPLIREEHPIEYTGYPFVTLIEYKNKVVLTIVDNTTDKHINAYILDLCNPEKMDEEKLIAVANYWYNNHRDDFPLSFHFSKLGLTEQTKKIYKTYNIDFASRVIGPLFRFDMNSNTTVKRRRRKGIPPGVAVVNKKLLN